MRDQVVKLAKRFKEPSSWAGLAVLAGLFGVQVGAAEAVIQAGAAICAAVAFFLPEGKEQ